jgi:hypothetical protein
MVRLIFSPPVHCDNVESCVKTPTNEQWRSQRDLPPQHSLPAPIWSRPVAPRLVYFRTKASIDPCRRNEGRMTDKFDVLIVGRRRRRHDCLLPSCKLTQRLQLQSSILCQTRHRFNYFRIEPTVSLRTPASLPSKHSRRHYRPPHRTGFETQPSFRAS